MSDNIPSDVINEVLLYKRIHTYKETVEKFKEQGIGSIAKIQRLEQNYYEESEGNFVRKPKKSEALINKGAGNFSGRTVAEIKKAKAKGYVAGVMGAYMKQGSDAMANMIDVLGGLKTAHETVMNIIEQSKNDYNATIQEIGAISLAVSKLDKEGSRTISIALSESIMRAMREVENITKTNRTIILAAAEVRKQLESYVKLYEGIRNIVNFQKIIESFLSALQELPDEEYKKFRKRAISFYPGSRAIFDQFEKEDDEAEYTVYGSDNNEQEQEPIPTNE
jgi:hypothetical protein